MDDALPIRLDRETIYESAWVNLHRDKVAMPNGHIIEQYHLLDFGRGAVAVIVQSDENILMERVARYPTQRVTWELPAGGVEEGESVLAAAAREVSKETGYTTYNHEHLYTYYPMNGIANLAVHIVRCEAGQRTGTVDKSETQDAQWFSAEALREMIRSREITDGLALTGLLLYLGRIL